MPDKIKETFDAINDTELFLDEQDFRDNVTKDPKGTFEALNNYGKTKGFFLDYNDFENALELKKKAISVPSFSTNLGDFTKPLPNVSGQVSPLASQVQPSSSQSNVKSVGKPKNVEEFNKLYGTNYANLATGEQINPFTASPETIVKNQPYTATEMMQQNNKVALERLSVKNAKLEKLKALKALKLQEPELTQKADELSVIIQDQTLPQETRVAAQNELKGIADLFDNAGLEVDQLNDLNEIDKSLTNRINTNESIRQQRLEKEYSSMQQLVEGSGRALTKLPADLGNMATAALMAQTSVNNPEFALEVKDYVRNALKPINEFADNLITQELPKDYGNWFSGKMSAGKLKYLAAEAIGQTIPTVAAGFLTGGTSAIAAGASMAFDESRNVFLEAGLSKNQADGAALGMAIPLGLLEKYGVSDIIAKPIGKKILAETAQEVIQSLGKKALTGEVSDKIIFETTQRTLGNILKKYGKDVIESAWKEPITEMSQAALTEVSKQTAEAFTGQDSNANQTTADYLKETGKSILGEGLSGALGGAGISAVTSALQTRTNPSAYDRALELKDQDLYDDFIAQMQLEVDKGILTPEQMELAASNVKKIQEIDAKIPKNIVGAERRSAAASLIAKKEELEAEIEGKDKTLSAPIVEEIKTIDNTLSEIVANKPIEEIENGLIDQNEKNKVEEKTLEEQKVENKTETNSPEIPDTSQEPKTETKVTNEEKINPAPSGLGNDIVEPIVEKNVSLTNEGNNEETPINTGEVQTEKPIVEAKEKYAINLKDIEDWELDEETDTYNAGETKNFNIEVGEGKIFFKFKDEKRQKKQNEELGSAISVNLESDNFNRVHIGGVSPSNLNKGFGKEIYSTLIESNGIISTSEGSSTEEAQRVWSSLIKSGEYYWAKINGRTAVSNSEKLINKFIDKLSKDYDNPTIETGVPTTIESNIPTSDKGTQGAEPIIKEGEAKVEEEPKTDRKGNEIGDGSFHVPHKVIEFPENDKIRATVSKSDTTESVYVTYTNEDNGKSITTRFSNHENNAVKFGDQLNGDIAKKDEILFHLGLKDRTFVPNTYLSIFKQAVARKNLDKYEEADKTIKELYDLGEGADISKYKGKIAKGSNYLILGDTVTKEEEKGRDAFGGETRKGKFIYTETKPTKAEKIASAEKSINDIRNKLKEKFKIDLPEGTKTAGFTMNDLIDLVADTAIQLAKTGIEINEAVKQAIQFLKDEGDLEGFDEAELESKAVEATKQPIDKKEEIRLRNKEADKQGRSTSEWLENFREQIVKPQELTDLLDEMKISKTILTNAETIKQAQEILDKYQEEYEKDPSKKDPINRVIDEAKKGDLGTAVGQVMMQILFKNAAKENAKALREGDKQKANFFFQLIARMVQEYAPMGTDAGRTLQVRKAFMDYVLSDPDLADFYYMKQIQNSNKTAKKDKTNIESANEIIDKVETTKKKVVKKVASKVVADLDAQIEAEITRAGGIGKNATEAKKKQVDAYFDKLVAKFDNKQTYSTIIPITPAAMVKMINAVRELVKGGIDLQAAISKVSADLIRNGEATPKETAAMKENLNGARKELRTPKEKTPEQIEREEANAELKAAKKEYNDKQKELKKAQLEAEKASEGNKKEAQKVVDKLTKEVISAAKKSDQNTIEDIIQAFYSKEEQVQSDLEKMVIEALNVTEKEAVKIAESIKNQMETELRSKLIKDFEKITKLDEEKNKKAATSEYVGNFIKGLTVSKPKKNTIVDKMLQLSMMGVLKTDDIMDLMKNKYGIQEFTFDMSNYIKEQARKINEADTQGRKNKEMAKMTDKMAELAPLYYQEAMNSLWYGAVLSGFGTQDANITFNAEQVVNSFYRSLALTVFNNLKNKGTVLDKTQSIGKDLYQMFFRTLYQASNEGKIVPRNLFSSSLTNLAYGLKEGVSSFAETQKALESQSQSEMDYSRYAKWMKFLNNFKYVGRALASMDLATQDLIKNSWIVPVLRDIYGKEGLSPKVIDAKIQQELTSNLNEIEVATNEAINDILKYDISVKKVGDKYHVMYENKIVFRADTEQEANDLKLEAAKKQTTAIKRFAYERLQTKVNEQALRSATHLSQETIMSAPPSGRLTSGLYDSVINLKNKMSAYAQKQEKQARASNKTLTKVSKGQLARMTYAVARIVPFVKMAINLAENFFIKDNPLGYVRAVMIEKAVANPKDKAQERLADFYQSQTQINDLKARAIIGTMFWAIPLLLTTLMGDDEEDKEAKYLKAETKAEEQELKELEESTGQPMEEGNPYLLIPKDGEVFGSLDFMQPQTKKALENAGLAKEHSIYKGVYPNGKFVSIVSDPSKFNYVNTVTSTVAMINKYVVNNKFDKLSDEDKKNRIEQVILDATLYSLMSFGSFSITKRSKNLVDLARQGKTLDAFAQVAEGVVPEFAVTNPAILRQTLRYIDGTAREFASPSNDFTTYMGTKIPLLGSFISVYGVEKRRGMFGEEMYSVPAMTQGAMSNYYYEMRFGDKNKPEKEMYQFLASKGYNKVKAMPTTLSIMSDDGKTETPITDAERNKLGAEAGQKVLKRLQSEKEYLSKLSNSIVNRYVDKLFNMEFKNAWLVYKGVYKEKQIKERNEEFLGSMKTVIEKQKEIAKRDKENKVTPEMKAFRRSLPKDKYDRKLFLARNLKPLTEEQRKKTLIEWQRGGVIENDTKYIEEIVKLSKIK
jgi:hypothetical protein